MNNTDNLRSQTISGLGWSTIDNVIKVGVTFIVSVILARLLTPDEYGLIGILTIFITVFNSIVDSGFTNALIRKKNTNDTDYSTIFYTNLIVSIIMALILFCCSKPIAHFFHRQELVSLTRVMSSVIVINALSIVQKARATKNVDFKIQAKVTFFSSVISGIIGITMAYTGYGVWALVGQQISLQLSTTILFWFLSKWVPLLVFSVRSFSEMWSFGWKLLLSGLIDSLWKQIYHVIIGKYYSPATLGQFTRASQFNDLCSINLTTIIQRVSFPVMSNMQDDPQRLKPVYQKVIKMTMLPTFVLMLGMASSSKAMILTLIGEQWLECVPMLQIMCLYGMLYPLHALNLNMLQVQGRTDLFLKLEIIKKIIAIVPILLGIFLGIYWMLVGSFITSLIAYYLNAYYSGPFLNYSIKEQVVDVLPSLSVAIIMSVPVYAISNIQLNPLILFSLQVVVGAIIVISICEKIKLPEYLEIKGIVMPLVSKLFKKE